MRVLTLLLLLAASAAFAQPSVTRGGALKKRSYQTYAGRTLYMATTGSDSNPCTVASPCLTLPGTLAKLPRFLRNAVTISVAAGTYTTTMSVSDFALDLFGGLSIEGTPVAVTPTTGTASGTSTAYSAAGGGAPATFTDSTQTWTVNDLRGYLLTDTDASDYSVIVSNTATTLTLAGTIFGAAAGHAYTITKPGTIFTTTSRSYIYNITGNGIVSFNDIDFRKTGTVTAITNYSPAQVQFNRCALSNTGTGNVTANYGNLYVDSTYVTWSTTGGGIFSSNFGVTGSPLSTANVYNSYVRGTGSTTSAVGFGGDASGSVSNSTLEVTTASLGVLYYNSNRLTGAAQNYGVFLRCNTSGSGLVVSAPSTTTGATPVALSFNGGPYITGCSSGVSLSTGAAVTMSGPYVTTATTAFSVSLGARLNFTSTAPTFSGVTNELQLDGENLAYSTLVGLTPGVISNSYGSVITR